MTFPKVLAFYLPQFHPTAQNDGWWAPGFTEWTNVARAKPLYDGHLQPHLPGELGYYDLRLPETRVAQAALAQEHGIDGFCYYHYWFGGRRMLDRVFDEVLETGSPDFPFCLLWANETWSRRWYDGDNELLMPQVYSEDDDAEHVDFLVKTFEDPRYVRVDGRPIFIVYRLNDHPDPVRFATLLRRRCEESGVADPYLAHVDVWDNSIGDPNSVSFDASLAFLPHRIGRITPVPDDLTASDGRTYTAINYETAANAFLTRPEHGWPHHQCVVPMWDNTARRLDAGGAFLLTDPSVDAYEQWLEAAVRREAERGERGIVFINAWNEWAEGAHLEPDLVHGRAYLEATRAAIERARGPVARLDVGPPSAPMATERIIQQLHNSLAAMHLAESEAFAAADREVARRTAALQRQLDEARAGERRLINLLDAILAADAPTRAGISNVGNVVTAYIDIVAGLATELDPCSTAAGLAALVEAAESALAAGVSGHVATVGSGSSGAAILLRSALHAFDRTGRCVFATDLGPDLASVSRMLVRLSLHDVRSQLFADSADQIALAPRIDSLSVLRIGALDELGCSALKDLLGRVSLGGVVVADTAGPDVVAGIDQTGRFTRLRGRLAPSDQGDPDLVAWTAQS